MTGDLKLWKGTDVADPPSVKFERKGGWFITKAQLLWALLGLILLLIAAVILTKYITDESYKESKVESMPSVDPLQPISPISYALKLNHSTTKFNGEVSLIFSVENLKDVIHLQFIGEKVFSCQIENLNATADGGNTNVGVSSMDYDGKRITITPENALKPGNTYNLTVKYLGDIRPIEKGVYNIPYKVPINGKLEDRWIIGASLAPIYCDRLFPCVHNTSQRFTFRLKIVRLQNASTVSNMFEKATTYLNDSSELVMDDYEWTPRLPSSSLTYFLLPQYQVKTVGSKGEPDLAVWYPPHLESTTTPVVELASSILSFYKEYFKMALPIQRISIVIIDGLVADHPSSLGVIPISSTILYSRDQRTLKREETLFYYLGRKFSNLWLGNAVNFKSWSDYWYQEGFALYMADLAASQKFLYYDSSSFILNVQRKAFMEEIMDHPEPLDFLSDVDNTSGTYTPYKGAFIFHMIGNLITPTVFQKGVQHFLNKWSDSSAEADDLWASFNAAQDNVDIAAFVKSWSRNGFPLVSVRYHKQSFSLQQESIKKTSNADSVWWIPIYYTNEESSDFDDTYSNYVLLSKDKFVDNSAGNASWIVINPQYNALFLPTYSSSHWTNIIEDLKNTSSKFPSTVRAGLIDNSFYLARNNLINYGIPLNLSMYLQDEKNLLPWLTTIDHLNYISTFLSENKTDYDNFKMYLEKQLENILFELKRTSEAEQSPMDKYLRSELLHWSCKHELQNGCNTWAKEKFEEWFNRSRTSILDTPELQRVDYCYGMKYHKGNITNDLINASRNNVNEPYEEYDILKSLTCTTSKEELVRVLENSLNVNDSFFSAKRGIEIWLSLKESTSNSRIAFEHVKKMWPGIIEKFKIESEILGAILEGSTYALTKESDLDDIKALHEQVQMPTDNGKIITSIFENIIERVTFNINWRKNNLEYVKNWFRNFNNTKSNSTK